MLDRIKNILRPVRRGQHGPESKVYKIWLLILPVLAGLVIGHSSSVILGYVLDKLSGLGGLVNEAASLTVSGHVETANRGLDEFLEANPFHLSSPKGPEVAPPAPKPEPVKVAKAPISLDNVVLRGTLPGIGAWLE